MGVYVIARARSISHASNRRLTRRIIGKELASSRGYSATVPDKYRSYALAGQTAAFSRPQITPDGIGTVIECHYGQQIVFVLVDDPKEDSIEQRLADFEGNFKGWSTKHWDVVLLEAGDVMCVCHHVASSALHPDLA